MPHDLVSWGMFDFLIERENEEMFRTSSRTVTFPDGTTEKIAAYRLVWAWFDRCIAYEFGPSEQQLLYYTLRCMIEEKLDAGTALGRVVNFFAEDLERLGGDITDDNTQLLVAQRRKSAWRSRNGAR